MARKQIVQGGVFTLEVVPRLTCIGQSGYSEKDPLLHFLTITWHNILLKTKIKVLLADVILARYFLGMKGSRNDSWMNVGVTLKMNVPGLMYLLVPWIFSFAIFFVAEIRNSLGTRWALIWDNYLRPESKNHGW